MKNLIIIAALFVSFSVNSQIKKVLFLGNSYTYVNDLPNLIQNLAQADGKTFVYDQNTPGGYSIEGHSTNSTSLNKISSSNWDFVVIQDQSQKPAFPPSQVTTDVYPYAKIIVDSINANNECTEPLFFMTWGRQNGDEDNCQYYEPLCTYEGMQGRLRDSYLEMAVENMASVSPVGVAWATLRELTQDSINLYSSDGSHPSIYGSYLAACVFYTSIFNSSPINNSFTSNLPDTVAHLLQLVAYNTVMDSNYVWNHTTADFGINYTGELELSFLSTGNFSSETWDFGDGTIVNTHNPVHAYIVDGEYSITHIVNNNCFADTSVQIINVSFTSTENLKVKSSLNLYPNPVTDILNIECEDLKLVNVYNSKSELILTTYDKQIDFSVYQKSIFFVEIVTETGLFIKKIINN